MTVERIPFSPSQVVVDVASIMRVRALDKQLAFEVEYATAIPATIQSDPTRLRQVLMNLVGNAIKFTERGRVRLVVHCDRPSAPQPKIQFTVSDEGIGISADQIGRLFRPFSQADSSTTRRFGGSGLGLVICKRLLDMMGGTISVESVPGKGSAFTVSHRICQAQVDQTMGVTGEVTALPAASPPGR